MKSMTGFGQASFAVDDVAYGVELRSVNNRYLDLRVHLPWPNAALESRLREVVRKRLGRGRVDLSVRLQNDTANATLRLNRPVAAALAKALHELTDMLGEADLSTASRLLSAPRDLLGSAPAADGNEDLERGVLEALGGALDLLEAMRAKEGAAAREDLMHHVEQLAELRQRVGKLTREEPAARARKLQARLERLVTELPKERLAQEAALLADRCDVSEELARLESHLTQLQAMLDEQGPVGRKFEFMLQEANREVNTIASKTGDARVARLVVEAKSCLERMREQIQNVE